MHPLNGSKIVLFTNKTINFIYHHYAYYSYTLTACCCVCAVFRRSSSLFFFACFVNGIDSTQRLCVFNLPTNETQAQISSTNICNLFWLWLHSIQIFLWKCVITKQKLTTKTMTIKWPRQNIVQKCWSDTIREKAFSEPATGRWGFCEISTVVNGLEIFSVHTVEFYLIITYFLRTDAVPFHSRMRDCFSLSPSLHTVTEEK